MGLAHLVALAATLTPDCASPDAVRRAVDHLAALDIIRREPLPTAHWCRSSLRKVVTTGGMWGCDTRFPTYGVPRGPFLPQYPADELRGHLIVAHRLAMALATNERVLADMHWLEAARLAAPRIAFVDRLSAHEGLLHTGVLPVPSGTLLGLVTTETRTLLFGGHWTGPLGADRLERVTRACWPVAFAHPGTAETAWVRALGRRRARTTQYAKNRVLPLLGNGPRAWEEYHTAMLAICRTAAPVDPPVLAESVTALLQWRLIPRRPGHLSPLVHAQPRGLRVHDDSITSR